MNTIFKGCAWVIALLVITTTLFTNTAHASYGGLDYVIITGPNQITVTYEHVIDNNTYTSYSNLGGDLAGRTITGGIPTMDGQGIILTFSGAATAPDVTGTIDIDTTVTWVGGGNFGGATAYEATDGQQPHLTTSKWTDTDHSGTINGGDTFEFGFSEVMDSSSVNTTNVDTQLGLSNGHTFGTVENGMDVSWSMPTTALMVTLGTDTNITSNDTVNPTSYVTDIVGNLHNMPAPLVLVAVPTVDFISPTPDDASSQATYPEVKLSTTDAGGGHYSFTDFDHSLLGWWRFENNANDYLGDSNGTWHGTPGYDTGKFGTTGVFNGTDNYIDATLPSAIDTSFTVSAWVNLNSLTWSGALISDANGHLLQIGGSNVWQFADTYGSATAETGVWTHVVGVYDSSAGTQTLYVNGEYVSSAYSSKSISQNINIGRREDGHYIDGNIDDVMIFRRALDAGEVASLYDGSSNQYDHTFAPVSSGAHTFTGYVSDTVGNVANTEERTVTLTAPELTEVTPIPSEVTASHAKYHFSVDGDATGYEYLVEECGTEVIIDPVNHIVSFGGLESGHTYGDCSFEMYSETGPATNSLHIGSFTITTGPSSVVGGYANNESLAKAGIKLIDTTTPTPTSPSLGGKNNCPADQQLTQSLHAPSRNGKYNTYTGAIVKDAKILQAHLNRLGFNSGAVDGFLGPISDGAIKRMQTFLKTTPDGFVGPVTRGLINNSCN